MVPCNHGYHITVSLSLGKIPIISSIIHNKGSSSWACENLSPKAKEYR